MWVNNSAGLFCLSLAVFIVGWLAIFYIRANAAKNDDLQHLRGKVDERIMTKKSSF